MNRFQLKFNLGNPDAIHSPFWVTDRLEIQRKMREWCQERIGEDETFPNWQFSMRTVYTQSLTNSSTEMIDIADGIYIFDPESRAAFKLTFDL